MNVEEQRRQRARQAPWRIATLIILNGIQVGLLEWIIQRTSGPLMGATWGMVAASGVLFLAALAVASPEFRVPSSKFPSLRDSKLGTRNSELGGRNYHGDTR